MSRSLRLHPAAQRELDEAAAYYDAESPGLGGAFLDEVEHAVRQVLAFPEASALAHAPVQVKVLIAFPYSVHFSVIGDVVLVLALAHHSRRPFYWRGRQ
jgi:plasmid stabilization system protein ParE